MEKKLEKTEKKVSEGKIVIRKLDKIETTGGRSANGDNS
jgi:hypothetical protein